MNNEAKTLSSPKTPLKNYILFSMPRTSTAIVLTIIDFAILFIYVEGFNLNPIYTGIAIMCGKFAIAISQSMMGWLSDKTNTKWGRRKPFMVIGAPILGISFIFLLIPTIFLGNNPETMLLFTWLLVFDILFQFFYGELTTPYQSWMAEQFEVNERPTASAWQNIFNYIGTGIAALITMLVIPKIMVDFKTNKTIPPLYTIMLVIFAVLTIILFYLTAYLLPVEKARPGKGHLLKDFKEILKDRNFIHVCMLIGIASLTWSMITGLMLGYVQKVLQLTNILVGAGGLAIGVVGSLFIWKKIINKKGKKFSLTIIFIWAACSLPFGAILPLFPFEDFTIPTIILVLIIASALGGWFLFPYIIYADLAENNKKSGEGEKELKAGLYTGFPSILLNIFQAFGLLITGIILSLPDLPARDYSFGYLLWAPYGSLILIWALLYTKAFVTLDFK